MSTQQEYCYESPFDIDVRYVNICAQPRTATIGFDHRGMLGTLTVVGPAPLSSVGSLFDELWQIRIVDRNFYGSQLEFGRFDVQLWDEGGPYASFDCDSYKYEPDTATDSEEHAR